MRALCRGEVNISLLPRKCLTADSSAALQELAGQGEANRAQVLAQVYGGLLPVGEHGRECVHCLVLNGPHTGRIVDIDPLRHTLPVFAPEADFLYWCVRFLDEAFGMKLVLQAAAVV